MQYANETKQMSVKTITFTTREKQLFVRAGNHRDGQWDMLYTTLKAVTLKPMFGPVLLIILQKSAK